MFIISKENKLILYYKNMLYFSFNFSNLTLLRLNDLKRFIY